MGKAHTNLKEKLCVSNASTTARLSAIVAVTVSGVTMPRFTEITLFAQNATMTITQAVRIVAELSTETTHTKRATTIIPTAPPVITSARTRP